MNQLVSAINDIIKNSPSLQQLKYDRISNTVGVVKEVRKSISKTFMALVEYTDSRDNIKKSQLAEIASFGGFNPQLAPGDLVLIAFPLEHSKYPTIVSKYSYPGTTTSVPGSSTTTISQGW